MDVRRTIIVIVIAVLYAVFVFSVIDAVYPKPEYEDFCVNTHFAKPAMPYEERINCTTIEVSLEEQQNCSEQNGMIEYDYDTNGCPTSYECNTCYAAVDNATNKHNQYVFYISAFFSLIAIFVGMYLPTKNNILSEWIGIGFMLGGAIALLFGTATAYGSLHRIVRPIVILFELVLVIFIAYKKTKVGKKQS